MALIDEILKVPPLDYTSRDYASIRNDLVTNIPFYVEEWTDHNASDLGITLLELVAFMGDVLHFYIDRKAENMFLPPSFSRDAVSKLLKLIDYELSSKTPAQVDLAFSVSEPHSEDIVILEKTSCQTVSSTTSPLIFETLAQAILPAGDLTVMVPAIQGESDGEIVGNSNGTPFQTFKLIGVDIIDNTMMVYIDEGVGEVLWTEVDNLLDLNFSDTSYTTQIDGEGLVTLFFGDNAQGKIPLLGASIRAQYRRGGGTIGNVGAGTIITLNDTIFDVMSEPVSLDVTNPNKASGGEDEETIEHAKRNGPRQLRTLYRAVTPEDFQTLAEQVDGVARAKAIGTGFRDVSVYIAPVGGGIPSIGLKNDVLAYLDQRDIVTTRVTMKDAGYVFVKQAGTVYVLSNYLNDSVEAAVNDAIAAFYDFDNRDFAENVYLSDVYRVIEDVPGVDHVDFTMVSVYPVASYDSWSGGIDGPVLGEVSITETTIVETWVVTFDSPTTFTVEGSTSGLQINTGAIDTAYTSDSAQVSFTITSGLLAPIVGDNLSFKTSKILANVVIQINEIITSAVHALTFTGGA